MLRRPPRSTRTDTRFPYTTLFRSGSGARKPALAVWMGGDAQATSTLNAAGVPTYASEAEAVRGFMYLVRHREAQQALMETPPSLPQDFVVDSDAAQAVVADALTEGRRWLEPDAVARLLAAYGIPLAPSRVAVDGSEERRVGNEGVRTCRYRWAPAH